MDSSYIRWTGVSLVAGVIGLASYSFVRDARAIGAGTIVMATGSTQYFELAESYRRDLERYGVKYEVQRRTEGFATLKELLKEGGPGVNAGFIKGGLVGSMQGRLATEKAKGRYEQFSQLWSVGRMFYEPIWVFTRGDLPIRTLRDLKGKRIILGTRDSGSRGIARQLLNANGVSGNAATFIDEELPGDAAPLLSGAADAAIIVLAADTDRIQQLLRVPNIRLMDFTPEAEAYTNRFPALAKVVLRQGAVEFDPLLPSEDITLLSTTVALVVRPDMQPALVSLLTYAVVHNPKSGFDKNGDPVLFYRAGEFPSGNDPEFEVANEARVIYKSGELPVILKTLAPKAHSLGIPFSYTAYINTHWTTLVGLLGALAILLPLTRALPALYVWLIRRRLVYWYRQLKALERNLDSGGAKYDAATLQAEFDRIDTAVRRIRVPLFYSDKLYDLRGHIDLVRQRLAVRPMPTRMAAE
jgi:uncharacterized protein